MNNKTIQKIKDTVFLSFFNIHKREVVLEDFVYSASANTGKSWNELMTEEFIATSDKQTKLEDFLREAGVICIVEDARKSTTRNGYYQALASDMLNKYMVWWRVTDIENGLFAKFEVEDLWTSI